MTDKLSADTLSVQQVKDAIIALLNHWDKRDTVEVDGA